MNRKPFFSEKSKLYDLLADNPKLLQLLPRFGIKLGFGDHSVAEVCKSNSVSAKLFLLVSSIYSNPDVVPHAIAPDEADMKSLLAYLKASHRYYLDERFPHIEMHLSRIIEAGGEKYGHMLSHFYNEYKREMAKHFSYEEEVVLPYIEALIKGTPAGSYSIEQFRHNHSNIEDPLEDMNNILIKYLPSEILPKERIEIATDINELSADLISHSLIEEKVLVPFVESLENTKP